tara:strand:+ start:630 stop:950 length:321 start_codon:yes stop_codon:yes gene_type:complete
MTTYVTKSAVDAANEFTDVRTFSGDFSFSISGTLGSGTKVTVQKSYDGTTFLDTDVFTKVGEFVGYEPEPQVRYRAGIKTGDLSGSSSLTLRFGGPQLSGNGVDFN